MGVLIVFPSSILVLELNEKILPSLIIDKPYKLFSDISEVHNNLGQMPALESNIKMWDVFKTICIMSFVFSQSGQNKIGNYGKGISAESSFSLSWTSFFEYLKHVLSHSHPIYLPFLAFSSVKADYSERFTLSCLPQEKGFLPAPSMLGLSIALASFRAEYIFLQLDFEIILWLSWLSGVLADMMEAEAWTCLSD